MQLIPFTLSRIGHASRDTCIELSHTIIESRTFFSREIRLEIFGSPAILTERKLLL